MTQPKTSAAPSVRRIIVYSILFVLVCLTATGLADLIGRAVEVVSDDLLVGSGTTGLAGSLTFTVIGGPLALLLGWFAWRRLADPAERNSLAYALYLVGMTTVALVVAGTALFTAVAGAVTGERVSTAAATGLVWAVVWAGHRLVLRRSSRQPSRLPGSAAVLGELFGLVLGVGGAITALSSLFDAALAGTPVVSVGAPWWHGAVQATVWALGGALIWWWHWRHDGGSRAKTSLAAVALVGIGILGGCLLTLAGTGTVLFVLLRLAVDRSDALPDVLDPLGTAVAAALVGGVVWEYHRAVVAARSAAVREASTLVTSGIALIAAATGLGVIVNALLAALTTPLVGSSPHTLLLGGISALLVGGPVWWFSWRPGAGGGGQRASSGRGVYLVVVFGISAVVALVTILVIGFRLFDILLAADSGLVDRIRAPLGLLVATGLVSAYHFALWRGDRAAAAAGPAPVAAVAGTPPVIGELVLIMGPDAEPLIRHLRELTGARVTLWQRAGAAALLPDPTEVVRALEGVQAERVVLVVAADGGLSVIPLAVAGHRAEPEPG
ncbi:MAG: DUF5671 domain-containing protein [Cryobacterium sp.]